MIRRSTWIVLAIFLILLSAVVYIQRTGGFEATIETPTSDTASPLFTYSTSDDVLGIQIQNDMEQHVDILRDDVSGDWKLITPESDYPDVVRINTGLERLRSVEVESELEENTPLNVIGLETPAYTLTIRLKDSGQSVITIGDETINGRGYYAQSGEGTPFVVTKSGLDALINFIQDPPILPPTDTPEPSVSETEQP